MKRVLFVIAALFLLSVPSAEAQTATLEYIYSKPLTEVNSYTQQILIDNVVLAMAPTCVATSANLTTCSVAAPALATGTHTVRINATSGVVTASTIITGIGGASAPGNANGIKVVITVTITSGS